MKTMTLSEYLKEKTMAEAAEGIGVTQGAVWQMVRSGRRINLTVREDGQVMDSYEIKPLGKSKAAA